MSFYFYCIFCHPQKPLHCHPQLDWGSRFFLFFFNTKRKGIYLGFCIKYRITKNTSWIPAFAGMTTTVIPEKHPTVIPNLIGDPVFTSFFVIPEIFYQELKVNVIPNLIGDPESFNPGFPLSRE